MGEISDCISAIKDLAKAASSTTSNSIDAVSAIIKPKAGSISSMALQGTANFAMLISDSIEIDDALMISRAAEQRFSTFLLTVLTMNPYLAVDKNSNPSAADYIKQFHQNMGTQYQINPELSRKLFESSIVNSDDVGFGADVVSFLDKSSDELGVDYYGWVTEAVQIVSAIYEGVKDRGINMSNSKFNYSVEDVTEQTILNNVGRSGVLEAPNCKPVRDKRPQFDKYLDNNDFKRANDSVPTLLHIRVYPYHKDTGDVMDPIDFIIGVKATLHQIPSYEMIVNIANGLRNNNTFFNFVRWTTGETKFFKDFLFAIDQQKIDAKNSGSGVSAWWSALRRRKASSTIRKFAKGKGCLPNATIVCSSDDLLALRDEYGFDLTSSGTELVCRLMSKYFLLSFIKVNPALQRVDFLFDGTTQYETYSYSTLSKDAGKDDKKFKDMMRMLGRGA